MKVRRLIMLCMASIVLSAFGLATTAISWAMLYFLMVMGC